MNSTEALPWSLDDIDFARVDTRQMAADDDLMCLLCVASFIESGSDRYAHNLVRFFDGDPEVQTWLDQQWEPEEMQHGRALSAYVRHVWPEFDWDQAFHSFFEEYATVCTMEELEPSRTLEMAARCVVETGTATLYRAIHESTDEPVLKDLTERIKKDEVRHYSYFYRYFRKYQAEQPHGRLKVLRTLWGRVREIGNEDGDIALRHVFKFRHPEYLADPATFRRASDRIYAQVRQNLAPQMAIKMVLKPLNLPRRIHAGVQPPLTWAVTRFALH